MLQQQKMSQDTLELNQRLEEAETDRRRMEQELTSARERLERARNDNMQVFVDIYLDSIFHILFYLLNTSLFLKYNCTLYITVYVPHN